MLGADAEDGAGRSGGPADQHALAEAAPAEVALGDVFTGVLRARGDGPGDRTGDHEAAQAGGRTAEAGGDDADGDLGRELRAGFP